MNVSMVINISMNIHGYGTDVLHRIDGNGACESRLEHIIRRGTTDMTAMINNNQQ